MTNRMILTLGLTFLCVGSTYAQEIVHGASASPVTPLVMSEEPTASPWSTAGSAATCAGRPLWVTGEYLFTFMRGTNLPPLVTTSPPGTTREAAGIIGAPGTQTLFGNYVNSDLRSGFRLGAGYWFHEEQKFGIEAGFMMIGSQTAKFAAPNDGTILARPYFDINRNSPQAALISFPGLINGSIDAQAKSGNLYEAHFDLTEKAIDLGWYRLNALLGYRYFRYDESLHIQQSVAPVAGAALGTQAVANDNFSTRNDFQGIDLGYRWQFFYENWSLELLGKVAVGRLFRSATIIGDQTVTVPGLAPVVQSAGLLALGSNSGTVSYADWRAIPEFGATLGWQVRPNLNVRVGYTFIYFNAVARAADQIDPVLNTNLFPGSQIVGGINRPALNLQRSDFWLQSANVGVEWTY